jgi:hypothetical protein
MSLSQRFLQPRVLFRLGMLLLLLVGIEIWFLNSKGHQTTVNKRSSEKFGEALQRIGIPTQPSPSK